MARQYTLTNTFLAISEEKGTIENSGKELVEICSQDNAVEGQGLTVRPGEKLRYNDLVSARSMGDGVNAKINVVDFLEGGGGSGSGERGPRGFTFIPAINDSVLTWTNDGELPNPDPFDFSRIMDGGDDDGGDDDDSTP